MSPVKAVKRTIYECRCFRCGWKWEARSMPLRCAGCKTPYWNVKPKGGR